MNNRKYYKTTITVEVLSEWPVTFEDLNGVHLAITNGDCSGKWEVSKVEELNGKKVAAALTQQDSDPSFFNLTPYGDDLFDKSGGVDEEKLKSEVRFDRVNLF
jgi:hypothetical protein